MNFNLIPFDRFELKIKSSKDEIIEKFSQMTFLVRRFSYSNSHPYKDFEGVLLDDGFELRRIIKIGQSAFAPILTCKVVEIADELHLKVIVRFPRFVNIFFIAIYIFQLFLLLFGTFSIVMLIIPYMTLIFLFNIEIHSLKKKFNDIVQ